MAWGRIKGINIGQTFQEKNYPGYKINYGIISKDQAISNGFIPLTYKIHTLYRYADGATGYFYVNGKAALVGYYYGGSGAGYGGGLRDTTAFFDLDSYFNGDIEQLKRANVTWSSSSIGVSGVVRWLEPTDSLPIDLQKNYPGYVLKYGVLETTELNTSNKTLSYDPRNYVPLTLEIETNRLNGSYSSLSITIGEITKEINGYGQNCFTGGTYSIDLEKSFGMDLIKSNNTITTSQGTVMSKLSITKWLIPNGMIPADNKIWLYKDGWINEKLTGGLTLTGVTNTGGKLNFSVGGPSSFMFKKLIETAGYKLNIEFVNNYVGAGQYFLVWQDDNIPVISFSKQYAQSTNKINVISLDTNSLSFQVKCSQSYAAIGDCVTKIWLE